MTMAQAQSGFLEAVKQVGFPTVVAGALMWLGSKEIDKASARFDKQSEFITGTLVNQMEKSNAVISAVNETLRLSAADQRDTRIVLREVLKEFAEHDQESE